MTERSGPWDGTSIGDATEAAYDAPTEFARFLEGLHGGTTNRGGVVIDKLNELVVTAPGSISPASVASGWGVVYGTWYESDAAVSVAIPTPAVSTRVDRIVLRKDWSTQTVRVTRIAGVEGAGAPSLVQIIGTTWDVPLAQVSITPTDGVITLTDQRVFIPVHGDRSGESGTHHSTSNISGLPGSGDSTPITPTYAGAGAIGADTNNYANDDHDHPITEGSRGVVVRNDTFSFANDVTPSTVLSFPVANGDTWVGRAIFHATSGADGTDLKIELACPAGTLLAYATGQTIGAPTTLREGNLSPAGTPQAFEVDISGGDIRKVEIEFSYVAAGNGTFDIEASQQTLVATPLVGACWLYAVKL